MPAAPLSAAPLPVELVAPVANMLAAAVAAGGVCTGSPGHAASGRDGSESARMEVVRDESARRRRGASNWSAPR
jgi:hypothetical protein